MPFLLELHDSLVCCLVIGAVCFYIQSIESKTSLKDPDIIPMGTHHVISIRYVESSKTNRQAAKTVYFLFSYTHFLKYLHIYDDFS